MVWCCVCMSSVLLCHYLSLLLLLLLLVIGGKWVKVRVHDSFPVVPAAAPPPTEGTAPPPCPGTPLLASSADPMELWPVILAKAVYTVSTACGFHHTLFPSPQQQEQQDFSSSSACSLQAAAFVSMAVHTLTGWLPSAPKDLSAIYSNDTSENIVTLLEEINFGGAAVISNRMIPDPSPIDVKHINEEKARSTPRKFTKKQLKDQMKKRIVEKDNLVKRIIRREKHINKIDDCVVKSFTEAFALVVVPRSPGGSTDENSIDEANLNFSDGVTPSVHPVLALSYPNRTCNDTDVQLLVDWNVFRVPDSAHEVPTLDPVLEEGKDDDGKQGSAQNGAGAGGAEDTTTAPPPTTLNPPPSLSVSVAATPRMVCETPRSIRIPFHDSDYPTSTAVGYHWVSLKTLCKENSVYIFGTDTKLRTCNAASYGWHWKHKEEPMDEKGKKGGKDKGKAKGGGEEIGRASCRERV